MNANSKEQMVTREGSRPASAEQRLKELGIKLPAPPADRKLAEEMSSYWVNFARSGDPNSRGLTPWPTFTNAESKVRYLVSGAKLKSPHENWLPRDFPSGVSCIFIFFP